MVLYCRAGASRKIHKNNTQRSQLIVPHIRHLSHDCDNKKISNFLCAQMCTATPTHTHVNSICDNFIDCLITILLQKYCISAFLWLNFNSDIFFIHMRSIFFFAVHICIIKQAVYCNLSFVWWQKRAKIVYIHWDIPFISTFLSLYK